MLKRLLLAAAALTLGASQATALDTYEKVWIRDTLIGAGGGLVVGLLTDRPGTWLLIGGISGAIFGYFDAEKGLITVDAGGARLGLPRPTITLAPAATGAAPAPEVSVALLHARF